VALRAEGSSPGYPELAQLLRWRADVHAGAARNQMQELFRRMVFNVLTDNTDDHEKNHVVLMDDAQRLSLAPAFDVLPTGQGIGYQQMRVGKNGADSTIDNALAEAVRFGLSAEDAREQARHVARVCGRWRAHFAQAGGTRRDIDQLAAFIDRDFLRTQREALTRTRARQAR
jgi:serine/threonine-protein kinase HipA